MLLQLAADAGQNDEFDARAALCVQTELRVLSRDLRLHDSVAPILAATG